MMPATPARVARPPAGDLPAPTASVSGQVRDESGAPIPGAVITVTAAARGAISRTTTGRDGRFEIGGLARGRYAVIGEQPGLLPAVIPELLLAAGASRSVILELKVPGITEVTTVATRNPIVDVQNATVGDTGGAMLRDIPNQRDVFALLAQTRESRCRARTSAAIRRERSRRIERTGCRASRSRPWMASTSPSGADLDRRLHRLRCTG